jgi:hypothetical protein
VRSTTAPYTESRLTRSVANERVGFPVVEHLSWVRLELFDEKKNQKSHDIVSLTFEKQRYGLWI